MVRLRANAKETALEYIREADEILELGIAQINAKKAWQEILPL